MPKYKVYATIYTFVEREVEANSAYEAEQMSYGQEWDETGSDFKIDNDMTEEITDA